MPNDMTVIYAKELVCTNL